MPEHLDVASLQLDTVLPARRVSLEAHELSEEYVILDFEHQRVHSLNRSAYLVFQYCDGQPKAGFHGRPRRIELGGERG